MSDGTSSKESRAFLRKLKINTPPTTDADQSEVKCFKKTERENKRKFERKFEKLSDLSKAALCAISLYHNVCQESFLPKLINYYLNDKNCDFDLELVLIELKKLDLIETKTLIAGSNSFVVHQLNSDYRSFIEQKRMVWIQKLETQDEPKIEIDTQT